MKITELKIKEDITPDVIAQAIEYISNSCFIGGTYNPYYMGFTERLAIVQYFLDGIEFEEGDSLFVISELDDVKNLIKKFYDDKRFSEQAALMEEVRENVKEVVEFKKQRLIHGADAIESIAKNVNVITGAIGKLGNFASDLGDSISNIAKIDFRNITKDDIEMGRSILSKLNASGVELSEKTIANIIKEAANFDIDKASQDIIDAKNKQIEELQKRNAELEKEHNARNVLAFKKEVDG